MKRPFLVAPTTTPRLRRGLLPGRVILGVRHPEFSFHTQTAAAHTASGLRAGGDEQGQSLHPARQKIKSIRHGSVCSAKHTRQRRHRWLAARWARVKTRPKRDGRCLGIVAELLKHLLQFLGLRRAGREPHAAAGSSGTRVGESREERGSVWGHGAPLRLAGSWRLLWRFGCVHMDAGPRNGREALVPV